MTAELTLECQVHFGRRGHGGRRQLKAGPAPSVPLVEPGRVPRVARLMALAIRFDRLLREGAIQGYAELARLGHVTRPRISQILNLINLAPDIQEALLFLPRTQRGRDPFFLRDLQPLASTPDWRRQRVMWKLLTTGMEVKK